MKEFKAKMQLRRRRRNIRTKLRSSGLRIYRTLFIAKLMAWILALRTMSIWWVFAEPEGFILLDIDGIDRFNKARKKSNLSKIRVRDANKMAVYRYPNRGWNVVKTHYETKNRGNTGIRKAR